MSLYSVYGFGIFHNNLVPVPNSESDSWKYLRSRVRNQLFLIWWQGPKGVDKVQSYLLRGLEKHGLKIDIFTTKHIFLFLNTFFGKKPLKVFHTHCWQYTVSPTDYNQTFRWLWTKYRLFAQGSALIFRQLYRINFRKVFLNRIRFLDFAQQSRISLNPQKVKKSSMFLLVLPTWTS